LSRRRDAPNRVADIVGDQQCSSPIDRNTDRTTERIAVCA
jgi:hypothetical protein